MGMEGVSPIGTRPPEPSKCSVKFKLVINTWLCGCNCTQQIGEEGQLGFRTPARHVARAEGGQWLGRGCIHGPAGTLDLTEGKMAQLEHGFISAA